MAYSPGVSSSSLPLPSANYTNPTLPNWIGRVTDVTAVNDNATGPQEYQLNVSGEGQVIPIVYGEVRLGIKIAAAKIHTNGYLYTIGVLCEGPVNAISNFELNNLPLNGTSTPALNSDVIIVSVLGNSSQTAYTTPIGGATLVQVFGATFADAMQNTAYLIIACKPNVVQNLPQITALVQGKLVYNPSSYALDFTPTSSQSVSIAHNGTLAFGTGDVTLECWVYVRNYASTGYAPLIRKGSGSGRMWLTLGTTGILSNAYFGPGFDYYTTNYAITKNVWNHVAVVYNKAGNQILYVNGTAVSTISISAASATAWDSASALYASGFLNSYADVIIDDVRVWSMARSQTQLQDNMNVKLLGTESNLKVLWRLDETSGTTATDATSNTNNGTINNAPGKVLSGVYFKPSDQAAQSAFSKNPSLCLADFITSASYGANKAIDWNSVLNAYNANNTIFGTSPNTEVSRELGLVIANPASTQSWIDTLRIYAGAFVFSDGATSYLIPDIATTVSATVGPDDIMEGSFSFKKQGIIDSPNFVEIQYTDTSTTPWRTFNATAYDATSVAIARRASQVSLPGILRSTQANREAIERLNGFILCDLQISFTMFDTGLTLGVGDVILVKHKYFDSTLATGKNFRIQAISQPEIGRWQVTAFEYNSAQYSTAVASITSAIPDTNNNSTLGVPPGSTPTLTEQVIRGGNGEYVSRIKVDWTAPYSLGGGSNVYPHVESYTLKVYHVGGAYYAPSATSATAVTAAIELFTLAAPRDQLTLVTPDLPGPIISSRDPSGTIVQTFGVAIQVKNNVGAYGSYGTRADLALVGKLAPPSNVTSVTVYEVGGECRISWTPAYDLDLSGYEIRYGTVGVSWANASGNILNRIDALRFTTKDVPAGTWDFLIKAYDSVGNYSSTEGRASNIEVSDDSGSFQLDTRSMGVSIIPTSTYTTGAIPATASGLWNMAWYQLSRVDTSQRYITEDNATFASKFSTTMGAYTSALATYHTNANFTASWMPSISDTLELGLDVSAAWRAVYNVTALTGTAGATTVTSSMQIGSSLTAWSNYNIANVAKTTGRYGRIQHNTVSAGTCVVVCPENSVAISALPVEEGSLITTDGVGKYTVQLTNKYVTAKEISLAPQGTTDVTIAKWDNVKVSPYYVSDHLSFYSNITSTAAIQYGLVDIFIPTSIPYYQLQAGDLFEYDVYIDPICQTTLRMGGLRLYCYSDTAGSTFAGEYATGYSCVTTAGIVAGGDTQDLAIPSNLPVGVWNHRVVALTNAALYTKYLRGVRLGVNLDSSGTASSYPLGAYKMYFKDLKITNGSIVRGYIYSSGDNFALVTAPVQNSATSSAVTVVGNRFDIHATNTSGSYVSKQVYWKYKGV